MTHHYERTHPVHQYQYTPPFIPCLAHAHEHNGGGGGATTPTVSLEFSSLLPSAFHGLRECARTALLYDVPFFIF